MKSVFCAIALSFCLGILSGSSRADAVEDTWLGTLDAGGAKLRIVFHLMNGAGGKFMGTLDSPDQGANGIGLTVVTYTAEELVLEIPSVGGRFEGKLSKNGRKIAGTWHQGPNELPLTLTKESKPLPAPPRPQTPKPPFPYAQEEVEFDSMPGVRIAGTLTVPAALAGRAPAIVLVAGSGPNTRNEPILNHQVFLVLADYLTRRGFIVLRYDKRGTGKSTGSYATATTLDFADDAEAAVKFLKARVEVHPKRIGMIGHSEGGLIAPLVASRNRDVAFVVMMAGSGLVGEEILALQGALIARATGATDAEIASNGESQKRMFAVVREETDPVKARKRMRQVVDQVWASLSEKERAGLQSEAPLYAQGEAVLSPWMRFFLTYDPAPTLRKVACPVLALNGSRDLQVPPKEDLKAIEAALKAGGNRDHTIMELPGLNHLFQTATTGSPTEYGQIEETMSPAALKIMGDWISAHTKQ